MGYSVITPRWLFVLAQATPVDLVGDPKIVDESLVRFDAKGVRPGDIVGIGISTGNCQAGYRVLREAKAKGATVIVGGIHATIFPDEPLEMGADAVVTGNGDIVWSAAVSDALNHKLQKRYIGGRVPGEGLLKARWDVVDPKQYMFATIQTVAGCPENCSFCSVWVTEGRQPRQRLTEKIIEEVNELYELGFHYVIFADDNFNPSTLGRIARETSPAIRKDLERIREERLKFFDEYDRRVPKDMYAFTQMTCEVTSDEEYLSAMYNKMRIRAALIGVESFSEEGLKTANKKWNPVGEKMVETIEKIQDAGILVLSSIICGLESDTVETLRTMRKFALQSGTMMAQFPFYHPYPGTKDFHEFTSDIKNFGKPNFIPKHKGRMRDERFWLKPVNELEVIAHPNMEKKELFAETQKCWDEFYSIREAIKRTRRGKRATWTFGGKMTYILFCIAFRRIYSGQGMAADGVKKNKLGFVTRMIMKMAVGTYNLFFRGKRGGVGGPMGSAAPMGEVTRILAVPLAPDEVVPSPSAHVSR
jgi:tRNA A37 methylthiotransferase MiaB